MVVPAAKIKYVGGGGMGSLDKALQSADCDFGQQLENFKLL